jgi:hypothetical protein
VESFINYARIYIYWFYPPPPFDSFTTIEH